MKPRFPLTTALIVLGVCVASGAAQDRLDIRPRSDLRGHRGPVRHLAFHPDGKLLVSAGTEGKIRLWDVETGRLLRQIYPRSRVVKNSTAAPPVPRRIESIAFSPDGKMIGEAAAETTLATSLRLWNPEDGQEIRLLAHDVQNMRCLAFTPDGKLIATNMRDPHKWGHKIVLRDLESGEAVVELRDDRLAASLIAFSADGKKLASAGARKIHIWDVAARKLLHAIDGHKKSIQSICFSPNGKLLVSGSADDTLRIWNVETGKMEREIEAEQEGVLAVAYSPSGRTIASAGADKTIKLGKSKSGQMRARLWGHLDRVLCLAFSPDGKTLASGSGDTTIALWKIEEPKEEDEAEDEEDEDDDWGDD
ncbi:MAG: WD40 repeat domain-containing protein [Phycisphaerae bacterium]